MSQSIIIFSSGLAVTQNVEPDLGNLIRYQSERLDYNDTWLDKEIRGQNLIPTWKLYCLVENMFPAK